MKISIRQYESLRYAPGWDVFVSGGKLEGFCNIGTIFERGDIWVWKINRLIKEFGIFPKEVESASPEEAKREARKYLNDSYKQWMTKTEVERLQLILDCWRKRLKDIIDNDASLSKTRWHRLDSYIDQLLYWFKVEELNLDNPMLCCQNKDDFDVILDAIIGVSSFCRESSNIRVIAEDIRLEVEEAIAKQPFLNLKQSF